MNDQVSLREYMDMKFADVERQIASYASLTRRELELLAEDRERQREAMQARVAALEKQTKAALIGITVFILTIQIGVVLLTFALK
jgi:hypothetical protein